MSEVCERTMRIDGREIVYREAGPPDGPVLLLPHGYPGSSYVYRNLMPRLADRWRLLAPDFPGFGKSDTPEKGEINFDFYTDFLQHFAEAMHIERYALYLHDYGSQTGLRLAIRKPEAIRGLIIQNGDIYEDALGPKYAPILAYLAEPSEANLKPLVEAISEDGFRDEFLNGVEDPGAFPAELWKMHWKLMDTPQRRRIALGLMQGLGENMGWFPRYQAYLNDFQPPTLIIWGVRDGYMPEAAARAYLRDLPDAELHLFDAGHWLLETHLEQVVPLVRGFLARLQA